jgi:zinc and cadmium transporter
MSPYLLATIYSLAILLAALAGGWIPMLVKLTHTRMQLALSFVAGVILGIGMLHLIPHGFMALKNIDLTVQWALGGFLTMFFMERFFHFHQHEAPPEPGHEHCDHDHDHGHHHHGHKHATQALSWGGVMLGMGLHSIVDGIALGAAIQVEADEVHAAGLAGFGTFLAVVLHKPFDSLTIGTLLATSGHSRRWRHGINFLFSLFAPLGVLAFFLGFQRISQAYPEAVGYALCFAGGAFICIATSDLLPEVQFHSHDRVKLTIALVLGVALAWAIVLVESSGHPHADGKDHDQHHDHDHAVVLEPTSTSPS